MFYFIILLDGSVAEWLACWTPAQKAQVQIAVETLSGNSLTQTALTHCARQPTAGFVTHVTCRLTVKNRDQLRNPTLGNRVWAIFYLMFYYVLLRHNGSKTYSSIHTWAYSHTRKYIH